MKRVWRRNGRKNIKWQRFQKTQPGHAIQQNCKWMPQSSASWVHQLEVPGHEQRHMKYSNISKIKDTHCAYIFFKNTLFNRNDWMLPTDASPYKGSRERDENQRWVVRS